MAHNNNLPCDGEGFCMACKNKPEEAETLTCKTCVTPWHVSCLSDSAKPKTLNDSVTWDCPDCSPLSSDNLPVSLPPVAVSDGQQSLVAQIRAIEADPSLTDQEKAKRRQEILSGKPTSADDEKDVVNDVPGLLDESFFCSFCMQLPEKPVTTPCGHNFCLKCFTKWVGQGKRTCAKCRRVIPPKMASQPRINSTLVAAIRMAKLAKTGASSSSGQPKVYHQIDNQNRPDKAFTTERAKKTGKANACSGKIFVTIPKDFFGPITAEYDPERNRGVLVGDSWEDRMECRQWGAHFPHVSGIAGQSEHGAQSVALSGGYLDDEDHGEWFLYTGSGGRDLSGNKRTNKDQSFDQKFDKANEALRLSCRKGYPIRVVRSFKEKRSNYAPDEGVRYDGVYRIDKCWRKIGVQGHKVCRYLFVRCDNEPAPWTSDEHGDHPRALPKVKELENAVDITERKDAPCWDYDEEKGMWMWKKPQPVSKKQYCVENDVTGRIKVVRKKQQGASVKKKLMLKEFSCLSCKNVMVEPLTTPCDHNFCRGCLVGIFQGQAQIKERNCEGRRTLRAQKNVMRCPCCKTDITDFLQNPEINRDLEAMIKMLQKQVEEEEGVNDEEEEDIAAAVVSVPVNEGTSEEADADAADMVVEQEEVEEKTATKSKRVAVQGDDEEEEEEEAIAATEEEKEKEEEEEEEEEEVKPKRASKRNKPASAVAAAPTRSKRSKKEA